MKINLVSFFLPLFLSLFLVTTRAQQLRFQGKITYERKENLHKQLDEEGGTWAIEIKKRLPKYRTDLFQLTYNTHQSIYKIFQEDENNLVAASFWRVAWNNEVSMDLYKQQLVSEKTVYDRNYHVMDSMPAYHWKLTGEYREIAGVNCRKATTVVMDSLFVIAFYSDEIPVSGGPESFHGLPGMILGLVIPKVHITIFATKLETQLVDDKEFVTHPIKKAKQVNRTILFKEIEDGLADWGKWGRKIYWRVVI
jgi:GLPGLI family protein